MGMKPLLNKNLTILGIIVICLLFLTPTTLATPTTPPPPPTPTTPTASVDVQYVYNITKALSDIVFTCYNESAGEIAKGRAYGTKGEHKAAQILYDNMTSLGLKTTLQQIQNRPDAINEAFLTRLEVLNYTLTLNDRPLDCYLAGSGKGPRTTPDLLNTSFSFHDLHVKPAPRYIDVYNRTLAHETQDFLFLAPDQWNDPNASLPVYDLVKPFMNPLKSYLIFHVSSIFNIQRETAIWYKWYPHCQGLLLYDFWPDCHDHDYLPTNQFSLPVAFITGRDGHQMLGNLSTSRIDLDFTQHVNTSVVSYNVIGELPGKDPSKTVLITSLYDGWWNQATADSAIGMAMVLATAKFYIDNHITPRYTMKFVACAGEEQGMAGIKYFDDTSTDHFVAAIDLNQLGFTQTSPRICFDIISNHNLFLDKVWKLFQKTDYVNRTGNTTDIKPMHFLAANLPGNVAWIAMRHPTCQCLLLLKDGGWTLHHRDGLNHTIGDVITIFNWTDSQVTMEMLTNLTLSLTNPTGTDSLMPITESLPNPLIPKLKDD